MITERQRADLRTGRSAAPQDSFNESAVGTGDLFLRAKWHFVDTRSPTSPLAGC